ncbi:hypothetical protein GQ44DRAFT_711961 [Phaeosphaeriaceae sp. PMI808]|nr:hypothetical protein GQ44DRAFT_711961 [Phaeosphaeriaceae sp. PMI808]
MNSDTTYTHSTLSALSASCFTDHTSTTSELSLPWFEDCDENCHFCNGTYIDEMIAQAVQDSLNFQPYRDLRSVARERQRQRTIRENKSGRCNSYKCRKQGQTDQRTRNKRAKREKLKLAVEESQLVVACYTRNLEPKKHKIIAWDVRLPEELDEVVLNMSDDVVRYVTFRQGAGVFESVGPYTNAGENFATWAQRRIAEMRSVKETRLRLGQPLSQTVLRWKRKKDQGHIEQFDIYTGDANTTTLPTNAYDANGHALLQRALAPHGSNGLCPIDGYRWFGECQWAWHRNMSGCWELGYAGCSQREGDWENEPIPCPHCCADSWGMFYGCYCREFGTEPAPEETQRCVLLEWVGREGRKIILSEEEGMYSIKAQASSDDFKTCEGDLWDVVSLRSSETWSIVDAEE